MGTDGRGSRKEMEQKKTISNQRMVKPFSIFTKGWFYRRLTHTRCVYTIVFRDHNRKKMILGRFEKKDKKNQKRTEDQGQKPGDRQIRNQN